MITKKADDLHTLVSQIFTKAGSDERNAEDLADHLVRANLSGVDTHGIWHVLRYLNSIQDGEILPAARPEIVKESPTSALIKGNWCFGQVSAKYAMQVAIEKAKQANVAVVGLVKSHHVGRLGHYVEMAAAEEIIGMVWAGGFAEEEPMTAPHGGRERVLHTNPISIGFPTGEDVPMMFDWATTALSGVKVINAERRGEPLPPNCIVDKEGNPTIDAKGFSEGGSYLPFGAHKGYCLMMAVEYLGRIFTGSDDYAEPQRGGPIFRHQGVTMIVMKADLFRTLSDYSESAEEMRGRVRAVSPAPGFEEVLAPGDMESRTREIRGRDGIPIADDVWQSVCEAAEKMGVNVP